jgi:hypothetical protein
VPVFNDKHLAYDFADAQWMWDRAQQLNIPLMAGSCLPLAWRNPWLEYPKGTAIQEALAVGYGGIEAYGYHTIETLLCMIERRAGGETGVVSVQCLEGDDVWKARDKGLWSQALAEAACAPIQNKPTGPMEEHADKPAVFLMEHRDGLKSAVLMLNGYLHDWAFAARVDNQIQGTEFFLQPDGPGASFGYLCRNIQNFFKTGTAPYPPERTLLSTGLIDAAMKSRYQNHQRLETPYLDIAYQSYDTMPIRPHATRPHGASVDRNAPDLLLPWKN